MSAEPLVKIRDMHFYRGTRAIFRGVDMDIHEHGITAIMGPSGTGKTTLLKLIGGQLKPDQGSIMVAGKSISDMSWNELCQARKRMGMLFQSGALFTNLSVYDNVAFPLRENTDLPEAVIHDLVLLKLQAVGLRGARDLMPSELSGGMARRFALARTIALDPRLIMYDEPFTGQDPISKGVIIKLIKSLNDALSCTSIVVSHDVAETVGIANYVYILSEGKVVGQGKPDEIWEDQSSHVKQFMHGLPDGAVPFHFPAASLGEDLGLVEGVRG